MTRMTMAAFAIVDEMDALSVAVLENRHNGEERGGRTHGDDVASNGVTEGEIACNCYEYVEESCRAD